MKPRHACGILAVVGVMVAFSHESRGAGIKLYKALDKYQANILPQGSTPFKIGKVCVATSKAPACGAGSNTGFFETQTNGSKLAIKPSVTPGDGGIVVQLSLSGVDCTAYAGPDDTCGNDGCQKLPPNPAAGKCGIGSSRTNPGNPVVDHVLDMSVSVFGLDLPDAGGILYKLQKGAATFEATGKNTIGGAALFGPLVTAVFNQPLGLGVVKLRDAYRVCKGSSFAAAACFRTSQCPTGQACLGGVCVPLQTTCNSTNPPGSCGTGNTCCPTGQTCFFPNGASTGNCVAGILCSSDSDCSSVVGEGCVLLAFPFLAPPRGVCAVPANGSSGNACTKNADCTIAGERCINGQCGIARCNLDSDCTTSGTYCADPGEVVACQSTPPLDGSSMCFAGDVYGITGVTYGCDPNLLIAPATCP